MGTIWFLSIPEGWGRWKLSIEKTHGSLPSLNWPLCSYKKEFQWIIFEGKSESCFMGAFSTPDSLHGTSSHKLIAVWAVEIIILQVGKLRSRKVAYLFPGYMATEWWSQALTQLLLTNLLTYFCLDFVQLLLFPSLPLSPSLTLTFTDLLLFRTWCPSLKHWSHFWRDGPVQSAVKQ
jgi:hypothetical protein